MSRQIRGFALSFLVTMLGLLILLGWIVAYSGARMATMREQEPVLAFSLDENELSITAFGRTAKISYRGVAEFYRTFYLFFPAPLHWLIAEMQGGYYLAAALFS